MAAIGIALGVFSALGTIWYGLNRLYQRIIAAFYTCSALVWIGFIISDWNKTQSNALLYFSLIFAIMIASIVTISRLMSPKIVAPFTVEESNLTCEILDGGSARITRKQKIRPHQTIDFILEQDFDPKDVKPGNMHFIINELSPEGELLESKFKCSFRDYNPRLNEVLVHNAPPLKPRHRYLRTLNWNLENAFPDDASGDLVLVQVSYPIERLIINVQNLKTHQWVMESIKCHRAKRAGCPDSTRETPGEKPEIGNTSIHWEIRKDIKLGDLFAVEWDWEPLKK